VSNTERLKIAIWLGLLLIALPLGIILLPPEVVEFGLGYPNVFGTTLFIAIVAFASWRLKRRLRKRMERGFGKEVSDEDLVSISKWIQIPDQAKRAAREADTYKLDE
jgi:hypothetical protein